MDLPNLFSSNTKSQSESLILFIIVSDTKIQTSLLELSKGGVKILSKSKVFDYENLEKCVEQTDLALQQLDKKSDKISETIFALNSTWIKDGEVIDEKKPIVKRLTDDLNLNPLGFIDVSESIAQQKVTENSLYSGLLVFLTKNDLLFTLVYQGKIKNTEVVGLSGSFESDFLEGVARVKNIIEKQGNYLPQKITICSFDLSDTEVHEYQQKVYEENWEEKRLFLQTPTVEILSTEKMLDYLAREAGKNAALHKGLTDFAIAATLKTTNIDSQVGTLESSEFGFSDPLSSEDSAEGTSEREVPTSFGIPIKSSTYETAVDELDNLSAVDDNFLTQDDTPKEEIVLDKSAMKVDWGHKKNIKWFVVLGMILGLLFLLTGIIFGAPLIATTKVEVTLNKKPVSKDIKLTLDTKATQTDVEKLIIAADTVTKKASGKSTIQTTGIKVVGENAKGKVKINNKTDAEKTFSKGTQLKSGSLLYELADEISVPAASSTSGTWGNAEVTVVASQIGADSNKSKDTELTIASYDTNTYNALVMSEGLTGGSSREVRVVAQKDLDELLTDLREELLTQINDQFADESGDGTYILPSKSIIDESAKFDTELEKEAESVTLNLSIEVEAVTYSGGDLKPIAQEILSKEVPDNYELEDVEPQILSSPSQTDLDQLEAEAVVSIVANLSSYAIPKLTEADIESQILGNPYGQAESTLTAKEEISKVSITTIPGFLNTLVKKVSSSADKVQVIFSK